MFVTRIKNKLSGTHSCPSLYPYVTKFQSVSQSLSLFHPHTNTTHAHYPPPHTHTHTRTGREGERERERERGYIPGLQEHKGSNRCRLYCTSLYCGCFPLNIFFFFHCINSAVGISVWRLRGCVSCCQFTFDRSTFILFCVIILITKIMK